MPKVTEQHAEARRRQILDAAAWCFARGGPERSTMDDICKQAGLSKGAVYGYFKSKEDIVAALKVESVQRQATAIRIAMQRREPAQVFAALVDWVAGGEALDDKRRADVYAWAEAQNNQRLLETQHLETQMWTDALTLLAEDAQQKGGLNPGIDAKAFAGMLSCIVYGAIARKSWDPAFDPRPIAVAMRSVLTP